MTKGRKIICLNYQLQKMWKQKNQGFVVENKKGKSKSCGTKKKSEMLKNETKE